jgi:hypothetical protein
LYQLLIKNNFYREQKAMRHYSITSAHNGKIMFSGKFRSFAVCATRAVEDNVVLAGVDLRRKNLANAMLDGADMRDADFTGANLSGANLSEAMLSGARFGEAALYNCCMAWSDLRCADFAGANFGATDISGADISRCTFSTLSAFSLDFTNARSMRGCTFVTGDGNVVPFARPPLVIRGLAPVPVVIAGQAMLCGHQPIDTRGLLALLQAGIRVECRGQALLHDTTID